AQLAFLGVNESPQFVGLHKLRTDAAHSLVEKVSALVADSEEQRENRSLVNASDAGDSANTHSFQQETDDSCRCRGIGVVVSKRPLARLRERRIAARAAVTLDSLSSVKSESLRFKIGRAHVNSSHQIISYAV